MHFVLQRSSDKSTSFSADCSVTIVAVVADTAHAVAMQAGEVCSTREVVETCCSMTSHRRPNGLSELHRPVALRH
jgi:hypothetical protein